MPGVNLKSKPAVKAGLLSLSLAAGFAIFLNAARAQAMFGFIEPYVGFGKVQVAVHNATLNDYDDKDIADGFTLGVKGGLHFTDLIFVGLDYNTGGPYVFGRLLNKAEWTPRLLGVGGGLDYKIIRFWLGYYPWTSIDDTKNTEKYAGSAFKIGFGLVVIKDIRANIDVILANLATSSLSGQPAQPLNDKYHVQGANVTISVPINFK